MGGKIWEDKKKKQQRERTTGAINLVIQQAMEYEIKTGIQNKDKARKKG